MCRCIDKDALLERLEDLDISHDIRRLVRDMPEIKENRTHHGRWISYIKGVWICDQCDADFDVPYLFCPCCGADMRKQ